jgi:hypothetical protein
MYIFQELDRMSLTSTNWKQIMENEIKVPEMVQKAIDILGHVEKVAREFDHMGPFHFCKAHNLLVNNSGEEFAVQFMGYYNELWPNTY